MNLIKQKTLLEYCEMHPQAKQQLFAWAAEVKKASWETPHEVKERYASASILENDRVCFNIKGNDYRLIVGIHYQKKFVYLKWFGSHSEYDKIDANTV